MYNKKSFLLRGNKKSKNTDVGALGINQGEDCDRMLKIHEWTKYSGTGQRETRTRRHMRVMGNRWKQSGIRENIRPVTHEETQVTWNERRVTFQNKTGSSRDKKPRTRHPSPRCDTTLLIQPQNFDSSVDLLSLRFISRSTTAFFITVKTAAE